MFSIPSVGNAVPSSPHLVNSFPKSPNKFKFPLPGFHNVVFHSFLLLNARGILQDEDWIRICVPAPSL